MTCASSWDYILEYLKTRFVGKVIYKWCKLRGFMSLLFTEVYRIKREVFLLHLAAYRAELYLARVYSAKGLLSLSLQILFKSFPF